MFDENAVKDFDFWVTRLDTKIYWQNSYGQEVTGVLEGISKGKGYVNSSKNGPGYWVLFSKIYLLPKYTPHGPKYWIQYFGKNVLGVTAAGNPIKGRLSAISEAEALIYLFKTHESNNRKWVQLSTLKLDDDSCCR